MSWGGQSSVMRSGLPRPKTPKSSAKTTTWHSSRWFLNYECNRGAPKVMQVAHERVPNHLFWSRDMSTEDERRNFHKVQSPGSSLNYPDLFTISSLTFFLLSIVVFFSLTEPCLNDPTPTRPQHPKMDPKRTPRWTRNGPKTDPK